MEQNEPGLSSGLALIGDGVGHVALTGVGAGLLLNRSPVLVAVIVATLGAITIELVRSLRASGAEREASRLLSELRNQLGERKGRQLDAYSGEYLQSKPSNPRS
mgnify:CR=1 FL=1